MGKLTGKVAIVTGSAKGIGAGIAKELGAEGASVVVNYASSQNEANQVVDEIIALGGQAVAIQANLSVAEDIQRLFAVTKSVFGSLDILVNNAGTYKFQPFAEATEEEFHRQFNTNVLGPLLAIKEAAGYFGPAGGSIINISSNVARSPNPTAVIYSATKAALDAITQSLAKEYGPRGIRVNSLSPGLVETEGFFGTGLAESEWVKQAAKATPLGRLGQPRDIAKVAVFLASDDAAWITGETIYATGGRR